MADERVKLVQDAGMDSNIIWPTPLQMLKDQFLLGVEGQASV